MRPVHGWRPATIVGTARETASANSIRLAVADWAGHVAGQHIDVRLTADDGYQATRSFSLSSAPGEAPQITVERLDDGEVSPYLVDIATDGDALEVRGPVGGYFVWQPGDDAPLLLVAGGSGIAPMRAIWRAARPHGTPVRLVYSARTADRVIFADELRSPDGPETTVHLTRERAAGFEYGRLRADQLSALLSSGGVREPRLLVYVCGPTAFVEDAARELTDAGLDADLLRTERFGVGGPK
ncbi:FAD-binding oxidoreductase [Streptomyces maoxianensis]|uniref:FAD-binding oxidoreductase n=1 Tax=Streptomyces maoxianensis TaxID=1459942 RepID=A0ABV9G441_9ACTN|nr:FAD-binding oxidoreductase [Streptomyces sp. ISL-1]MBT2393587.1 oxidoreductase [Streptomyces sp. ISL-1]